MVRFETTEPEPASASELQVMNMRASFVAATPGSESGGTEYTWIWRPDRELHYYDLPDGSVRVWENGEREDLRPPPLPAAPVWSWDGSRKLKYWRDEPNKCWRYENGLAIPFITK